jgi:putative ABC transport system permease protein
MNLGEIIIFALRGLSANKLRSGLTTLGILIGVGAVILLVAVGNGSSLAIQKSIQRLGANSLTVMRSTSGRAQAALAGGKGILAGPNGNGSNTAPRIQAHDLTVADAKALQDPANAPAVKTASPVVTSSSSTAAYQGSSHQIGQLVGT